MKKLPLATVGALLACMAQSQPAGPPARSSFWDFPPRLEGPSQPPLTFEVASVCTALKLGAGRRITGGPGTDDPTRFTYSGFMSSILQSAFGVRDNQFENRPEWTLDEKFEIEAKVPLGSSGPQVQEMLQNLLRDRFHLAYHWTEKEIDSYSLVVAKGGPKLRAAAPASGPAPAPPKPGPQPAPTLDQDGFPRLPEGDQGNQQSSKNGVMRMTFRSASPAELVARLSRGVFPLVDMTGLTGPYDFTVEYDVESFVALLGASPIDRESDPAPDIFAALEKQLGLKMEKGRTPIDVVVIDHLDRRAAEN